ncbi:MAG: helix-turn-helix transcriptional regulator [Oribacterium sp.]|nr:helix-turn-helix transcriptional regulator [Oribacterium sp.]
MNLKDYIKKNKLKLSAISKTTGIPYTTLGDIVNGKTDIDNAGVKVFMKLAQALSLSMDDLYALAKETSPTPELDDGYSLKIRNGKYYITTKDSESYLCRNDNLNAHYIKDIANTYINNIARNKRMESWQTML